MKKIPYKTIVLVLLSLGNIIVLILSSLSLKNINGNKKIHLFYFQHQLMV